MNTVMRIAIIECKMSVCDELCRIIKGLSYDIGRIDTYNSFGEFTEVAEGKIQYDLLFLNIVLGRRSGVNLANDYREYNENAKLVFYCENMDKAPCIFETKPFGLLIYPFKKEQIKKVIEKSITNIENDRKKYVGFKNRQGLYCLNLDEIILFESNAREVVVHHTEKTIKIYKKLDEIQEQLVGNELFIRCHQSFLVNIYHVSEISDRKITMRDGKIIPIARSRLSEVRESMMDHLEISI